MKTTSSLGLELSCDLNAHDPKSLYGIFHQVFHERACTLIVDRCGFAGPIKRSTSISSKRKVGTVFNVQVKTVQGIPLCDHSRGDKEHESSFLDSNV